jgi:hypothetical protein
MATFAETMRSRYPARGSDEMRKALDVALDTEIGIQNKRAEVAKRDDLSPTGRAQELARRVQPLRGNLSYVRSLVEIERANLERQRAALMPQPPTDDVVDARAREIRGVLRDMSAGDFTGAVLNGDKELLAAVLTSPIPFKFMTPEVWQRALATFIGPDVLAALDDKEQAIRMVEDAVHRAEEVANSVARDAQAAAAPRPSAPVLLVRQGIG